MRLLHTCKLIDGIDKLDRNHFIYLILLASTSMLLWFSLTLLREWEVLAWTIHLRYAGAGFTIVALGFFLWIIWVNGKLHFLKHVVGYPILFLTYIGCFTLLSALTMKALSDISIYELSYADPIFLRGVAAAIAFPVATTLWNILLAWMERKSINMKNVGTLLLTSILIPILSSIIASFLFFQSYLFPEVQATWIEALTTPLIWLDSGSLLFSFLVYEGIFILWVKSNEQLQPHPIESRN